MVVGVNVMPQSKWLGIFIFIVLNYEKVSVGLTDFFILLNLIIIVFILHLFAGFIISIFYYVNNKSIN